MDGCPEVILIAQDARLQHAQPVVGRNRKRNPEADNSNEQGGVRTSLVGLRRGQQVVVFGMLAHKTLDELAFDREFAFLRPHRFEGCARQL